jgi:hypothetical protein
MRITEVIMRKPKITAIGVLLLIAAMLFSPTLYVPPTPTSASSFVQNVQPSNFSGRFAQVPAGLHMEGVTLRNAAGDRVIAAGLNVEAFRDYANGCGWVTDGFYSIRGAMADRIRALNVNIVRMNYSYRFLQSGGNLNKYLDIAAEFAARGIYVMPADHTYTGDVLTNSGGSFPMMKQIIDGMRARGYGDYLIMGGWNEPGPDVSVEAWKRASQNLLTELRKNMGYSGIVVIDGTGWSTLLDVPAFKSLMTFDAGLRADGKPNVIFSHHLYPNITQLPAQIFEAANQVPLMIGELGQENPGASSLRPQYVKDVIGSFLNAGLAAGHNGIFAWIWNWCDTNKMIEDWDDPSKPYTDKSPLTSHGVLWKDSYFSKLPPAPPPQATIIVQQPTRTSTRTSTPAPTRTTALPTNTKPATQPPKTTVAPSAPPPTSPPVTPVATCPAGWMKIEVDGLRINGKPLLLCGIAQ